MFIAYCKEDDTAYGPFDSSTQAEAWVTTQADSHERFTHATWWKYVEVDFVDLDESLDYRKTFGPGALESLELKRYKNGTALLVGTYTVYCGMGNDHTVEIETLATKAEIESIERMVTDNGMLARTPDDLIYQVVSLLVSYTLDEEWSDPCTLYEESED